MIISSLAGNTDKNNKFYKQTEETLDAILKGYKYPIKLISRHELSDMVLNSKNGIFYFNNIQSSADKMISVVNGLTGEIIYSENSQNSYKLKPGDLGKLSKEIK